MIQNLLIASIFFFQQVTSVLVIHGFHLGFLGWIEYQSIAFNLLQC